MGANKTTIPSLMMRVIVTPTKSEVVSTNRHLRRIKTHGGFRTRLVSDYPLRRDVSPIIDTHGVILRTTLDVLRAAGNHTRRRCHIQPPENKASIRKLQVCPHYPYSPESAAEEFLDEPSMN